ncbi:unnamed protein product [Urochloa humidicola]
MYITCLLAVASAVGRMAAVGRPAELGIRPLAVVVEAAVVALVAVGFAVEVSPNRIKLHHHLPRLDPPSFAAALSRRDHRAAFSDAASDSIHTDAALSYLSSKLPGSRRRRLSSPRRLRSSAFWNRGICLFLLRRRLKIDLWAVGAVRPSSTFASRGLSTWEHARLEPLTPVVGLLLAVVGSPVAVPANSGSRDLVVTRGQFGCSYNLAWRFARQALPCRRRRADPALSLQQGNGCLPRPRGSKASKPNSFVAPISVRARAKPG